MQMIVANKNRPSRAWRAALFASLLIFAACSGSMPVAQLTSSPAESETILTVTLNDSEELAGTKLVVPAGALAEAVNLTVNYQAQAIVMAADEAAGPVAQFGPAGTRFGIPARVTIPVRLRSEQSSSRLYVDVLESTGERARLEGADLSYNEADSTVSFEVSHFTSFQAGVRGVDQASPNPVAPDATEDQVSPNDAGFLPATDPAIAAPGATQYPPELKLKWDNQLQPLAGENRSFSGVWSASSNDAFMVDRSNKVTRRSGAAWSQSATNASELHAIWGTSTSNVWAVGPNSAGTGEACRFNGATWACQSLPQAGKLASIWGSSSTNVWASA